MKSRPATTELCRLLTACRSAPVSEAVILSETGLSGEALARAVGGLTDEGFVIRKDPLKGYFIESVPSYDLTPSLAGAMINPSCPWGKEIHVFDSLASTQETAKRIGRKAGSDGLIVISEEQTGGRGRRDRKWFSPRGRGLYFSVFFTPSLLPGKVQLINLAAALAVKEGVKSRFTISLDIKWPNDLLRADRKICGILSEASSDSEKIRDCCTGIGINVVLDGDNPESYGASGAAALSPDGKSLHRGVLCVAIIEDFYRRISSLAADGGISLLSDYREQCSTIGKKVSVLTEEGIFAGTATGIGEGGELIVKGRTETRSFCAADVVHATPDAGQADHRQ